MPVNYTEWWPAWLALGVAALITLNQLISESERFANALGRVGRWWHQRARRAYHLDVKEFADAVREAVTQERTRWEEEEARALKTVEGRLEYITKIAESQQREMSELNFQVRCLTAYTEYEADWHHRLRMMMLQVSRDGGQIDIDHMPNHVHYAEFEKQCKAAGNMNWRGWDNLL